MEFILKSKKGGALFLFLVMGGWYIWKELNKWRKLIYYEFWLKKQRIGKYFGIIRKNKRRNKNVILKTVSMNIK